MINGIPVKEVEVDTFTHGLRTSNDTKYFGRLGKSAESVFRYFRVFFVVVSAQ